MGKLTIGTEPGDEEVVCDCSGPGDAPGKLIWPAGIALDSQENVYVTDEWLHRVSIFDKDGNCLSHWGTAESEAGAFNGLSCIAIDQDDTLYIVDSRHHRVQTFTTAGKFLHTWGSLGSAEGRFNSPWGITIDQQGDVYVADHKNHCVQVFGPNGKFVTTLLGDAQELSKWAKMTLAASPGAIRRRREVHNPEQEWRFSFPTAVLFDAQHDRLIVSDTQRNRLQIYNKLKNYVPAARTQLPDLRIPACGTKQLLAIRQFT